MELLYAVMLCVILAVGVSVMVCPGYPVPTAQKVNCTNCGSIAHKQHWNAFVVKTKACPWCHAPQSPVF